jgi:hypothetical protein
LLACSKAESKSQAFFTTLFHGYTLAETVNCRTQERFSLIVIISGIHSF